MPEQNKGYQVTCQLDNGARGKDDNTEIAAADNTNKNIEDVFVTNGLKYTTGGASIEEWASGNILSMPLLEFLARDYCLSIATPRLRMEGILNVPAATALPLLYRGGGLIYWPDTWDWNLYEDRLDVSMVSLPAAAIQVTSVTRVAEGSGGFAGSSYPGGGGAAGPSYFEENGSGGVKLLDDYNGLFAKSLEAVNNGDVKGTWKGVPIDVAHGGTGLSSIDTAYAIMFSNSSFGFSLLSPNTATTKKFLSQTGNGASIQSNAPAWSSVGLNDISGGIDYKRGVVISTTEQLPLLTCLFETGSGIGTVGLTLGITPTLSLLSKSILMALMFFGRVGGLTLIYAALPSAGSKNARLPLENVSIG